MIIDIHTHTFPDKIASRALGGLQRNCHTALFSDGTEKMLRENEKRAGVDVAVVQPVATYPEQVASINNHVLERFGSRPVDGILSFAAMHPAFEGWEPELERIAEAGIPGIKLHAPFTGVDMDDPRTVRILKKCAELDLIVLIHSGWDIGLPGHAEALPGKIRRALDACGPLRFIAAHMAGWSCWAEAAELLADTGIWLDTAVSLGSLTRAPGDDTWSDEQLQMMSEEEFCRIAERFGTEHILFGSDSPWSDPAEQLGRLRRLPLSAGEIAGICGDNAARLLRL